jgi:hypothetical protein
VIPFQDIYFCYYGAAAAAVFLTLFLMPYLPLLLTLMPQRSRP